jgi:hypothetical protein
LRDSFCALRPVTFTVEGQPGLTGAGALRHSISASCVFLAIFFSIPFDRRDAEDIDAEQLSGLCGGEAALWFDSEVDKRVSGTDEGHPD